MCSREDCDVTPVRISTGLCKNHHEQARYQANKERINAKRREMYDPEKKAEYRKAYRSTSKGKAQRKAEKHRRRALESTPPGEGYRVGVAIWQALKVCLSCGMVGPVTIDHIIPLSLGGTNTVDNIQPLCNRCNSKKGNRSTKDYKTIAVF